MSQPVKDQTLSDFYNLVRGNQLNTNYDLFDTLLDNFVKTHPEVKVFHCNNDTFSNSLLIAIPLSSGQISLLYLDQHNSEIIRMNFSKARFNLFCLGLNELQKN